MTEESDFDGNNMDGTIIKLAESYASCDRRSADINGERANLRETVEKLGIPSKSFQHAVGMVKQMSEGERRDYQVGVNRVLKAISDRQNDLFPEAAERIRKREERNAKVDGAAGAPDPDTNPRSDPASGGAAEALPADSTAQEQQEGEAALDEMAPSLGKKRSQSSIAAEKREKLGLVN
jgi:hypothetical protein